MAGRDPTKPARSRRPPRARVITNRGATVDPDVVVGRNPVVEALLAGVPASALHVASGVDVDRRVRKALDIAQDSGLRVAHVSRDELDRLANGTPHQGIVLRVLPFDYSHPDDLLEHARLAGEIPLIVALDGITDPHNLGAIARSVSALGGHGLVVPERRAARVTAGAWKASAGALASVAVARVPNLTRVLRAYQKAGLFAVGLAASGEVRLDDLFDDFDAAGDPLVLVVGSEGKGLSRLVAETCDLTASIPISGGAESLNASVAAGIALYEITRRRARARATGR